jgi:hypothetical protein
LCSDWRSLTTTPVSCSFTAHPLSNTNNCELTDMLKGSLAISILLTMSGRWVRPTVASISSHADKLCEIQNCIYTTSSLVVS